MNLQENNCDIERRLKLKRKYEKQLTKIVIGAVVVSSVTIAGYFNKDIRQYAQNVFGTSKIEQTLSFDLSTIPEYSGEPYVTLNENKPNFTRRRNYNPKL